MPADDARLVLLGAPGAGKGTQAKRLAFGMGLEHISTGDMFRAEVEGDTPLGREVKAYLDSGRLVPDELTVRLLERRIRSLEEQAGFVLDGFPRTEPQAQALDTLLGRMGRPLDLVLFLTAPDEDLVERMAARRQCPACGAIYNVRYAPPRDDEICDFTERHGPVGLVQRSDDREETVRRRLEVFHENTEPVIGFYRRAGLLATVDAAAVPDMVFDRIREVLETKGVVNDR